MKMFKDYVRDNGGEVDEELKYYVNGECLSLFIHAEIDSQGRLKAYDQSGDEITGEAEDYEEMCIQDWLKEQYGTSVRFCEKCGKPMQEGYTDECGGFYICTDCFEESMDSDYGKGNWRETEDENSMGGYYEYRESEDGPWEADPSFWTDWYIY